MRKFTGGILLCQFKHLRKVELTPVETGTPSTVGRKKKSGFWPYLYCYHILRVLAVNEINYLSIS